MQIQGFREGITVHQITKYLIVILCWVISIAMPVRSAAQGLLVTPRRVVFEGNRRTQELNLANAGKDTATYTISFVEIRMKDDGSFEEITKPDSGQQFASSYLRIFPRIVTLGPDEVQTVKVQLMTTSKLSVGEYRSHLYFKALPKEKPVDKKRMRKMVTNLSLKLTPVFGVTIPVLIHVGNDTPQVTLSDVSLEMKEDIPNLGMIFNRFGRVSAYGDVKVEYISPEGKVVVLSLVKGFSVYAPNNIRRVNIKLKKDSNIKYNTGKLHITYTEDKSDNPKILAEAYYNLS